MFLKTVSLPIAQIISDYDDQNHQTSSTQAVKSGIGQRLNSPKADQIDCLGCKEGKLLEYLIRFLNLSYYRMPISGLKSLVFHAPSPTFCIAAGNVWMDLPNPSHSGCLTQGKAALLQSKDLKHTPLFDWRYFLLGRLCLRLTKFGYERRDKIYFA